MGADGQGPAADVYCRYVELGLAGPADNELRVTTTDYVGEVVIARRSAALEVSEEGDPIACSGSATPSVTNVDHIAVAVSRESLDSLTLELHEGFFSPGATVESDGTGEIEVSLEQAPGTVLSVLGTSSSDYVQLGSVGGGSYGVNLNGAVEATPDADVTGRNAYIYLALRGGGDRVDPLGRAAFASRAFNFAFGVLGGQGDDVLVGNDRRNVLIGRQGRDRLVGNGLGDQLLGGAGADHIDARDHNRDAVGCGRGRDVVQLDRADRRRGCE